MPFAMVGAGGRMGRQIVSLAARLPEAPLELVGALEASGSPLIGRDAGTVAGIEANGVPLADDPAVALARARVAIDFSGPENSLRVADECARRGTALVVGTTGFSSEQRERLAAHASRIALLVAPNMSVGVNVLFFLVRQAALALGDAYDVEIVETHHHFKKDAPSGTAVRLKDILLETLGREEADVRHGRQGIVGQRTPREIGMHALRGGDVVGDHTVYFFAEGERVELTHRASSRDTFARGAIAAALFLSGRAPGAYTMDQVLGFA